MKLAIARDPTEMNARQDDPGRARRAWLSPYLLAVVLSPALLQPIPCNPGNPNLASLEVEAVGLNRVVGFSSGISTYDVWTPAGVDMITLRAQSAVPGARVLYTLFAGTITHGFLGIGGGEVTLAIPLGPSTLRLDVSDRGTLRTYTVNINSSCSLGECDDANSCTTDVCDTAVSTCEFTTLPDGASCDFGGLPGLCISGVCQGLCDGVDCDDGDPCTTDSCDPLSGACSNVNTCPDLDPPVLTASDFNPKQVDVSTQSQTVVLSMTLTDAIAGVARGWGLFRSPSGQTAACGTSTLVSGDEFNGVWECTVVISQNLEPGTWTLVAVQTSDAVGNGINYETAFLQALGSPTQLDVASDP